MKILLYSDLHLSANELANGAPSIEKPDSDDIVIVAGDVYNGAAGVQWVGEHFSDARKIIFVPGNHDYYGSTIKQGLQNMHEAGARYGVTVLNNESIVIDGVKIIGATLWTDYRSMGNQPVAMLQCAYNLLDHRVIKDFWPADARKLHQESIRYISAELATSFKTVVVTHHAPHRKSIDKRYATDLITAGFVSHLPSLVKKANIWVHGHTHTEFDYSVGTSRVICNPRGYPGETSNNVYSPIEFIIEENKN